jgi:hypothetical protein
MLDRPRIVKEGKEAEEDDEDDEDDEEDEELPSYLREQSSDEEHAALYSKNKLNANGESCFYSNYCFHVLSCPLISSHIVLYCPLLFSALLLTDLFFTLFMLLLLWFTIFLFSVTQLSASIIPLLTHVLSSLLLNLHLNL